MKTVSRNSRFTLAAVALFGICQFALAFPPSHDRSLTGSWRNGINVISLNQDALGQFLEITVPSGQFSAYGNLQREGFAVYRGSVSQTDHHANCTVTFPDVRYTILNVNQLRVRATQSDAGCGGSTSVNINYVLSRN